MGESALVNLRLSDVDLESPRSVDMAFQQNNGGCDIGLSSRK